MAVSYPKLTWLSPDSGVTGSGLPSTDSMVPLKIRGHQTPPRKPPELSLDQPREEMAGALEAGIHSKEEELAALGDEINAASERGDVEGVRSLGNQFREAQAELDRLLEQWARE